MYKYLCVLKNCMIVTDKNIKEKLMKKKVLYIEISDESFECFFVCVSFEGVTRAYGSTQARGQIWAAAASLRHSHSNARSELHLLPIPQLRAMQILNPLSEAREQTRLLMDISWVP